jgi:hypothetical protein
MDYRSRMREDTRIPCENRPDHIPCHPAVTSGDISVKDGDDPAELTELKDRR